MMETDSPRMTWDRLICDIRFGLEHYHDSKAGERSDFQRDFDRLVFSSPFRRLQNKTQVFPLPGSIFVHNRLTHSVEVSSVGRSMASDVAAKLRVRYDGAPWVRKLDAMGEIVAAACLAHDLGNPPFGHSGEKAIAMFFAEGRGAELRPRLTQAQWDDLCNFEGNANAFRLLTHQFKGRRHGGFAMTYSTLASIVKYPYESGFAGAKGKFGFFSTEKDGFIKVADHLGMLRLKAPGDMVRYARHPLVLIVEAADDICYEIMDIEDAHKLGILSTPEVKEVLLGFFDESARARRHEIMAAVSDPNEQVAYLRSSVIGALVNRCASAFVDHEREIMSGEFSGSLIDAIPDLERDAYRRCVELSFDKIYRAGDVVDIELAGHRIITSLLDAFIRAILNPDLHYSRLLLSQIPQQYDIQAPDIFGRVQAAVDHVSGMTDVYALDLYRKLNGTNLKINN